MKTSRFTDSQIIAIVKQAEAGSPVPELCPAHGGPKPLHKQSLTFIRLSQCVLTRRECTTYFGVTDEAHTRLVLRWSALTNLCHLNLRVKTHWRKNGANQR